MTVKKVGKRKHQEDEGEGVTAEQRAAMEKAYKEARAIQQRQEEEEEQEGRGKRAKKPKPQAEEPAKSPKKKKGSPKKKGK